VTQNGNGIASPDRRPRNSFPSLSRFTGSARDRDAKIGLRGVRDGFALAKTFSRAIP
jgi:hypothetical protein